MNYVSCSPFRVPIARLAAAQVAVEMAQASKTVKAKSPVRKPAAKKAPAKGAAKKVAKKPVKKAASKKR